MERIQEVCIGTMGFIYSWNALLPYRILRIVRIYKAQVIRSNGHPDGLEGLADSLLFFLGELYVLLELLQSLYPVSNLPFPVVPLGVGYFRKKLFSS